MSGMEFMLAGLRYCIGSGTYKTIREMSNDLLYEEFINVKNDLEDWNAGILNSVWLDYFKSELELRGL